MRSSASTFFGNSTVIPEAYTAMIGPASASSGSKSWRWRSILATVASWPQREQAWSPQEW